MKTLKNKFWALLLITSVAFFSCKKPDPLSPTRPVTNTTTTSTNNPTFTKGEWKIELFQEANSDETQKYRGYLFTFKDDGSVIAKKDTINTTGFWSTVKSGNQMKFMINFPSSPLSELNDDWKVRNESYTDLMLEHESGGDGSKDYLNFTRYFAQSSEVTSVK